MISLFENLSPAAASAPPRLRGECLSAFCFLLLSAPFVLAADSNSIATPLRASVSQYGITWTLAKPVPVGQFVNGDFYVVGPVTVVSIAPKPLWGREVGELIDRDQVRESKYPGQ